VDFENSFSGKEIEEKMLRAGAAGSDHPGFLSGYTVGAANTSSFIRQPTERKPLFHRNITAPMTTSNRENRLISLYRIRG
jgi:hypothetical protein